MLALTDARRRASNPLTKVILPVNKYATRGANVRSEFQCLSTTVPLRTSTSSPVSSVISSSTPAVLTKLLALLVLQLRPLRVPPALEEARQTRSMLSSVSPQTSLVSSRLMTKAASLELLPSPVMQPVITTL